MPLQITDLSFEREILTTLPNEMMTIVGGAGPAAAVATPTGLATVGAGGANLQDYNAAYSLSIANLNKVNILTVGSGASFNAAFSVGSNSKQVVTGAIGYNAQVNSPYVNVRYA